jgi:hypothetical protein
MMSTVLLETCREVKYINTVKKCVNLVINKNRTEMHGQQNIKFSFNKLGHILLISESTDEYNPKATGYSHFMQTDYEVSVSPTSMLFSRPTHSFTKQIKLAFYLQVKTRVRNFGSTQSQYGKRALGFRTSTSRQACKHRAYRNETQSVKNEK